MTQDDQDKPSKKSKAQSTFIRLALAPYTVHFKSPSYLQPQTLDVLDKKVCKEALKRTAQDVSVRDAIGSDPKYWADLVVLFKAAIPSLERRSFTIWKPLSVDYESTSGALIAKNYPGLWRDLERLNDMVSISRNLLTIGSKAQDLAAAKGIENEVFRIVNCCVRVTARGYDGDAGTGEEDKWQWVVNSYKKLLITCLQLLNNLVAQNEKRKAMLWVSLFDASSDTDSFIPSHDEQSPDADLRDRPPQPPIDRADMIFAYGSNGRRVVSQEEYHKDALPIDARQGFLPFPKEAEAGRAKFEANGYVYWARRIRDTCITDFLLAHNRDPSIVEVHLNIPRYWRSGSKNWNAQQQIYEEALFKWKQDMEAYAINQQQWMSTPPKTFEFSPDGEEPLQLQARQAKEKLQHLEAQLAERRRTGAVAAPDFEPPPPSLDGRESPAEPERRVSMPSDDTQMLFTAEAGAKILESGKAELMKRLECDEISSPDTDNLLPTSSNPDGILTRPVKTDGGQVVEKTRSMSQSPPRYDGAIQQSPTLRHRPSSDSRRPSEDEEIFAEESLDEEEEDDEEEEEEESDIGDEDDDEDYPGSTEDGRGLLTDVPLILGPSEIEVLPMLIMSGVVPRPDSQSGHSTSGQDEQSRENPNNSAALLTHLLLSQTSGRNLLRELLIFVAAWDLREEELYFKFMIKIMEAILMNGLMPYAYHAFRDRSRSKDIISPAQAVIMKLLTCIFRSRFNGSKNGADAATEPSQPPDLASTTGLSAEKVDLHVLNFIFTEFRQHIIPQTCALIFLQGQIHKGRASPDDFPLNLWDMERMYEGVYQYLEFFAALTDDSMAQVARLKEQKGGVQDVAVTEQSAHSWKRTLAEWEMASELVTLLRELEGGIPKVSTQAPLPPQSTQDPGAPQIQRSLSADAALGGSAAPQAKAVAVERPFELDNPSDSPLPPPPAHGTNAPASSSKQIFEPETPLAYPEEAGGSSAPPLPSHELPQDQDEPSDFEWRNLKKLTVLVLSSLVWKNKSVQDQVRKYGGLEALVGCCRADEHNPYIREHAIMCLRFAVEGNVENSNLIRGMANRKRQTRPTQAPALPPSNTSGHLDGGNVTLGAGEDVPHEVLDTGNYETFVDLKGQVGLRPKQPTASTSQSAVTASVPPTNLAALAPSSVSGASPPPPPVPASLAAAASSALSALQHDLGLLSASTAGSSFSGKLGAKSGAAGKSVAAAKVTKITAEKAAEMMQTALRDLPSHNKPVTDHQKAEALARLDRAFETTEQALGKGFGERGKKG